MNDESQESQPAPVSRRSNGLRKFVFTMGVFAIVWLLFGQIAPRLLFQHSSPPVAREPIADANVPISKPQNITEPSAEKNEQAAELAGRIDKLEARLKASEDMIAGIKPADTAALDAKIAALEAKVDALPHKISSEADAENMTHLQARLDEQEKTVQAINDRIAETHDTGSQRLAILVAFGQLKEAFLRGEGYAAPLNRLKLLIPNDSPTQVTLVQLSPAADKGVITVESLKASFQQILPQALAPANADSVLGKFRALIRVRKVGETQKGEDDEAVLARAEAKLSHNDVAGCVAELSQLSPAAAAVVAPWVGQAKGALQLRQALDALQVDIAEDKPEADENAADHTP